MVVGRNVCDHCYENEDKRSVRHLIRNKSTASFSEGIVTGTANNLGIYIIEQNTKALNYRV